MGPHRIGGCEGGWRSNHAADEYDRYMRRVAEGLYKGEPSEGLVDYLISIETVHMGLTATPGTRMRAEATVAKIREKVESLS